jgi:peptidase E
MQTYFLSSAFDQGFTKEFAVAFKQRAKGGMFVFVTSDFDGHAKTDQYLQLFCDMFEKIDVLFSSVEVVDSRVAKERAQQFIVEADVVWLAGGNTLLQMRNITNYELSSALQRTNAIVIGMSAGAINMATDVVLARNTKEGVMKLTEYPGIGLVDISVEPHFMEGDTSQLENVLIASERCKIYCLHDNSFILIEDSQVEVFGQHTIFLNGIECKNK